MKNYIMILITAIVAVLVSFVDKGEPETKAELGKLLFSDPILSKDRRISCASCHLPAYAFADTSAVSKGVAGKRGVRNTPSAMNLSLQRIFFWDGRSATMENQALEPIKNPVEMNLPIEHALLRLKKSKKYNAYFKKIFNSEPTKENLAEAIAAFERTLETTESPFDDWKLFDDSTAVSEEVIRGFEIFSLKGKCTSCHFGSDFTQREFKNIGLFDGKKLKDSGRSVITGKMEDIGRFKTPGLRNIAITAPYMHNGMFKTLKEVVDFYNEPDKIVPNSINRDTALAKPLGLTKQEKDDLVLFLEALTDKRFKK